MIVLQKYIQMFNTDAKNEWKKVYFVCLFHEILIY